MSGLKTYLFGDVAVIDSSDIMTMSVIVVLTFVLFYFLYRPLLIVSFDRQFAYSLGIPVRLLDAVFQMFLAIAIVISLQAVGVVLVSAMLIIPAATAYLLADRMNKMIFSAIVIGVISAILGVFFLSLDLICQQVHSWSYLQVCYLPWLIYFPLKMAGSLIGTGICN